jgi:CheY-like chemotaxis protein
MIEEGVVAPGHPVLVVEDDQDVRTSLVQVLEGEGYVVSAAENGREALDMLRAPAQLPELILLDLMMPVMNGRHFLEEQSRDPRLAPIPVLVMTASSNDPDFPNPSRAAGDVGGAHATDDRGRAQALPVLRKPFALERLLSLMATLCASARNHGG